MNKKNYKAINKLFHRSLKSKDYPLAKELNHMIYRREFDRYQELLEEKRKLGCEGGLFDEVIESQKNYLESLCKMSNQIIDIIEDNKYLTQTNERIVKYTQRISELDNLINANNKIIAQFTNTQTEIKSMEEK